MRWAAIAVVSFFLAACGSHSVPGPAEVATVVTVTPVGPSPATLRMGQVTKPLRLPGPVSVDVGSLLELDLQEIKGARPWASPVSSNLDVLSGVAAGENAGYRVARFQAKTQGAVALRTLYPCGGGACAVAMFELDVVVGAPRPGTMVFSGAVSGTSSPGQLTCLKAGSTYHSFSVLMEGTVAGKPYFFRVNAYPYIGPGLYSSVYRQPEPLDYGTPQPPDPLATETPTGYPAMGFLNFLPMGASSYSTENKTAASTLVVDADQTSGFLSVQLEQSGGTPLHIVGSFVCGPPFNP